MASSRVSFRAQFDDRLTAKENKDALKDSVQEALAALGLAIDEGDVKFHHRKLVRKKNKKPKFVVMGLDVAEGESMDIMKASAAFAEGGDGRFTVRWGEATRDATRGGRGETTRDTTRDAIETTGDMIDRVKVPATKRPTNAPARNASKKCSSLYGHEHRSSSMTSTLLAGVVCAVGLGGALLMGYHHSRWGR